MPVPGESPERQSTEARERGKQKLLRMWRFFLESAEACQASRAPKGRGGQCEGALQGAGRHQQPGQTSPSSPSTPTPHPPWQQSPSRLFRYLGNEDSRFTDPKGVAGVVAAPDNAEPKGAPSLDQTHLLRRKWSTVLGGGRQVQHKGSEKGHLEQTCGDSCRSPCRATEQDQGLQHSGREARTVTGIYLERGTFPLGGRQRASE